MNPSTYIPIIILWIIIFYVIFRNRRAVVARQIIKKRKMEGNTKMKELAKRFIDKECVISSFDGNHQYEGIIKEVTDGATVRVQTENPKSIPTKRKPFDSSTSASSQAIAYRGSHKSSTTCKSQHRRARAYGKTPRSNPSSLTRNTRVMPSSTRPTSRTACLKR